MPASLIPLGVVLFFAGLMSNSDTSIFAISSHIVFSRKKDKPVRDVRLATIITLIGIAIISYFYRNIVDITVFAAAITIVLSIPMIYLLAKGEKSNRFIGSLLGGFIGLFLGIFLIGLVPILVILVLLGGLLGLFVGGFWKATSFSAPSS